MTRQIKWNDITRKWEVIFPEDEGYENSVTQFWARACGAWVTIPA